MTVCCWRRRPSTFWPTTISRPTTSRPCRRWTLSPYWPQQMSPLVPHEVDGEIQEALRDHPALWLTLYEENSVDPGRFLPAYLTAVAYRDNCVEWDDVELCRFVSPPLLETQDLGLGRYLFAGELGLQKAMLAAERRVNFGRPHAAGPVGLGGCHPAQCRLQGFAAPCEWKWRSGGPARRFPDRAALAADGVGRRRSENPATWRCHCRRRFQPVDTQSNWRSTTRPTCRLPNIKRQRARREVTR